MCKGTYTCAGCLQEIEPKRWPDGEVDPPDDCMFLPVPMGYYSGFTDLAPWDVGNPEVFVCHDCWVKVLEILPGLAPYMMGGHPRKHTEKPCCDYAYAVDSSSRTYYTPVDGEWGINVPRTELLREQ